MTQGPSFISGLQPGRLQWSKRGTTYIILYKFDSVSVVVHEGNLLPSPALKLH